MPNEDDNLEAAILNETATEDFIDAKTTQERINDIDGKYERDEVDVLEAERRLEAKSYQERIDEALKELESNKQAYLSPTALSTYSPKFLNILENIQDPDHIGLTYIVNLKHLRVLEYLNWC